MYSHGFRGWLGAGALAVLTAWAVLPGAAAAQSVDGDIIPAVVRDAGPNKGNEIQQVGCASCGGGLLSPVSPVGDLGFGGGCSSCGGGGKYGGSCAKKDTCTPCGGEQCYAGRKPCDCCWEPQTHVGAVMKGVYNCICCNDPCYEPSWISLANSAFTLDSPRPVTHMKLGMDSGWNLVNPDKGELFFARLNSKGPKVLSGAAGTGGLLNGNRLNPGLDHTDYLDAYLYNEAAPTPGFGFFIYLPIRHVDPIANYPSGSGFGDMIIGTKSVILDCELLLTTFQFKTFLPTGNFTRGVGTGHVSLEPSLLSALKLTPRSYLQGQLGFRFPIGGDAQYQGSMPYGSLSYNHLLCNCGHGIELIGTLEGTIACLTNGQYTDTNGFTLPARSLGTFANAGPGLRLVLCNQVDIGVAYSAKLTDNTPFGNLLRAEFRWRF